MPFRDTIPAALHGALWLPWQGITLTLSDVRGEYTSFVVHRAPEHGLDAYNVAIHGGGVIQRNGLNVE